MVCYEYKLLAKAFITSFKKTLTNLKTYSICENNNNFHTQMLNTELIIVSLQHLNSDHLQITEYF